MTDRHRERHHGWCSLRLRFDDRELLLLRGAEHLRGAALAHVPRPGADGLRNALTLAKAGHKLGTAVAGQLISLDEHELGLLVEALHYATGEVQWATHQQDHADVARQEAVYGGFPELKDRGLWRGFGLSRELESLARRLETALSA